MHDFWKIKYENDAILLHFLIQYFLKQYQSESEPTLNYLSIKWRYDENGREIEDVIEKNCEYALWFWKIL